MTVKSPGGSLFPYHYKGGEIHCLKYGSFNDDKGRLFELMEQERTFVQSRPALRLRIWVDFYDTTLDREVIKRFSQHIASLQNQIIKLAIVGFSYISQLKLRRALIAAGYSRTIPCEFFNDPEIAKTWLVKGISLEVL